MQVIGIDASTSATGVVVVDDQVVDSVHKLVFYGAETFKGCETFWEKCDEFKKFLIELKRDLSATGPVNIERFFIEEPLKRFSTGLSSAGTISMLQRFNGIVCYLTRDVFGVEPTYINVSSARKAVGIKVMKKAKAGGRNAKQQAFDHMMANDLSTITWPKKQRSENIVDWAKDVTDAYIVARAGLVLNQRTK
jgi:hypothetical protein